MIRRLLLIPILTAIGLSAWSQASLEGKVTDDKSGEALIFANVILYKNGNLITGAQSDLDGNYVFSNVDPGTYDVEASYTGYTSQRQTGVLVLAGKAIKLDFKLSNTGVELKTIEVKAYKVPLIEQDNTTQGGVKTAEQIRNLPTKNINAIAATTAGLSSIDGGAINIRGSRSNATNYIIDGIRVNASLIPQSEIEQLQVITGGIEARYGDVTGGLISLTTKGPSAALSGSFEVESSELTDPYGYNLFSGNLSGPILKNKTTNQSILGFRVSAQYRQRDDTDPQALKVVRAKPATIARLSADPLTYFNGAPIVLAEQLTEADVDHLKARPNTGDKRLDLTGKLDFKVNDAIDFTLGGTYFNTKSNFSNGQAWDL
ncbi:MAG TPA: TonB-dependent receptor, partial [Saprospiraceae bacterium]|nr:TonB-dependent receptor [Saprospiraceae bacterium]